MNTLAHSRSLPCPKRRLFHFKAAQAGVYLFRLLWPEGDGDASLEWFSVDSDGNRALVGGSQPGALKTFRIRTSGEPAAGGRIADVALTEAGLTITDTGTLKSAAAVAGPYEVVPKAASLLTVPPAGDPQFYIRNSHTWLSRARVTRPGHRAANASANEEELAIIAGSPGAASSRPHFIFLFV
ncbi:MAG: hypothetical protein U1G07_08650 [Verrucomicrobiota bacterium]